jgi:hypothetical protein
MSISIRLPDRTITIDVPVLQVSGWQTEWHPGAVDCWVAYRKFGTSVQLEIDFSTRSPTYVDRIVISGDLSKTIICDRQWPAGRSLSYRLGVDPVLHPAWNRRRLKYGPLDMRLPDIPDVGNQQTDASLRLTALRNAIETRNTCFVENVVDAITSWDGPFPCYLPPDPGPGVPGGAGIFPARGWQNCEAYAQLACEIEAIAMSRMWAFYNVDGTPHGVDNYTGISPLVIPEQNQKPPLWAGEDTLALPVADSHIIRILSWCIAAWEMTGSPLARRHIIQIAEQLRLKWSEKGVTNTNPNWVPYTLSQWEMYSIANPGQGGWWDRRHGWLAWMAAMLNKLGYWSRGWQDWSGRLLTSIHRSQMPNGMFNSSLREDVSTTQNVAASMHESIVAVGALALCNRLGRRVQNWQIRHADVLLGSAPRGPYYGQMGPMHFLFVGDVDQPAYAEITTGIGEPSAGENVGEIAHMEMYLACLHKVTGNDDWLQRSLLYGKVADSTLEKHLAMLAENDVLVRNFNAYLLGRFSI